MKKIFLILIVLSLITACNSSGKSGIGTIEGITMEKNGEIVVLVNLDNGDKVRAIPLVKDGKVTVTGGQKVEVERMKKSKLWKIIRIVENEE